ncbi:MAG: glycosyltransferase [Clostridiales bacterium]|nr:glycosyltransferase [Clostridiales bacterium]
MIYIRTVAYNAEKTLRRAIESVLGQTHANFRYYLCDNGSTDGGATRLIVEKYAAADSRIAPFYNKANHVWDGNEVFRYLPHNIGDDDFYCTLDADDEYTPAFLEEMLAFTDDNRLDIAVCGSYFYSVADGNRLVWQRLLAQNLLLQGSDFASCFPLYYQFMRTVWGKLFKGRTLRNMVLDKSSPDYPRAYGGDTYNTMSAFRDAQRVGILAKSLHKYYMSPKSTSYVMHPERIKSDQALHEAALKYLEPYGKIGPQNEKFLYQVHFYAVIDTLSVLLNSQLTPAEKIENLGDVFSYEATRALLHGNFVQGSELDEKIRDPVLKWLLFQGECRKAENAKKATEILEGMYQGLSQTANQEILEYLFAKMPEVAEYLAKKDYKRVLERIQTWFKKHDKDSPQLTELEISISRAMNKPDGELFALLVDIREKRPRSSAALDINSQITEIVGKYPMIEYISPGLAAAFADAVCWVIKADYSRALDEFIKASQNVELPGGDEESYILLAQNLSAAAEDTGAFIYFKKIWVSYLLDCSRKEEAAQELDEFGQILPDDEDFAELRERLK